MKLIYIIIATIIILPNTKANDSSTIFINQAKLLQKKALHSEALKSFEKSTKYSKPTAEVFYLMAVSADSVKRVDKMRQYYEQAYLSEPTNIIYAQKLSVMYYNYMQYAKLITVLQKLKPFEGYNKMLGIAYYKTEKYKQAINYLELCNESECDYYMAKTYDDNNDLANAGKYYIKSAESKDAKPTWIFDAGFAAFNASDYKRAAKYLQKSYDMGRTFNSDMKLLLLKSLMAIDKVDEAEIILKPILESSLKPNDIYKDIGTHLYEIKKYDRAISYFEIAFKNNNNDAMALYQAGLCFIAKGNKNQGSNMCDKAIILDPKLASLRNKSGGIPFGL